MGVIKQKSFMQNYAIYSENFEIYAFHYKTYGHGLWYDEPMTYDEAVDKIKEIIYAKVAKDNPHLDVRAQKDFQPVIEYKETIVHEVDVEVQKQFEALKSSLDTFEFKEDAELYLSSTDFKYNIEAKNIVNKKPSKNI